MKTLVKKPAAPAAAGAGLASSALVLGFAIVAMACMNPSIEAPREETGKILISFGVEGAEDLKPAGRSYSAAGPARTVVPSGFGLSTFTKFEASFTATNGGTDLGPVTLSGGGNAFDLEVGTYTVTITAYTGSSPGFTAIAEGAKTGVVVTSGETTNATITLGPKTGAGTGTFSYDITVVPSDASGTMTVTTVGGGTVNGGTVSLPAAQQTAGTVTLDPGYYAVLVNLTRGGDTAGDYEIIHIYAGMTSSFTESYAAADFNASVVLAGEAGISLNEVNGAIAVTADPANRTIQKGVSGDLTLTVPAGYTVTAWYINGVSTPALGTGNTVTLSPDDYEAKTHRVLVSTVKDGVPYSWRNTFTVEAAGGGGGISLSDFTAEKIQELIPAANTADTALTLVLDNTFNLSDGTTLTAMRTAITAAARYIALDLSACTANDNTLTGAQSNTATSPNFNYLSQCAYIIGLKFPSTVTSLGTCAIYGSKSLRWVSIPDSVTGIGIRFYSNCTNLTRYILGSGLVEAQLEGAATLPSDIKTIYFGIANPSDRAGVYVKNIDTGWSKES
ncbi:MAG: leucine-rich repeat domain-containing protein [Treponema sp.]|jgi:hypothetical protein|nr:leucine-rich repeat domain-containing protein [Treponema sp.]